jgi:hypothetical protein
MPGLPKSASATPVAKVSKPNSWNSPQSLLIWIFPQKIICLFDPEPAHSALAERKQHGPERDLMCNY